MATKSICEKNYIDYCDHNHIIMYNIIQQYGKEEIENKSNLEWMNSIQNKKLRLNSKKMDEIYVAIHKNINLDDLYAVNGAVPRKEAEEILDNILKMNVILGEDRTDLRYKKYIYQAEPELSDHRTEEEKWDDFICDLSYFLKDHLEEIDLSFIGGHLKEIYENKVLCTMLDRYTKQALEEKNAREKYFLHNGKMEKKNLYKTYAVYLKMLLIDNTAWMEVQNV